MSQTYIARSSNGDIEFSPSGYVLDAKDYVSNCPNVAKVLAFNTKEYFGYYPYRTSPLSKYDECDILDIGYWYVEAATGRKKYEPPARKHRVETPYSSEIIEMTDCPDCGVAPGRAHLPGCDVERCSVCGAQLLGCGHDSADEYDDDFDADVHDPSFARWSGFWPGTLEARALGIDLNKVYSRGLHRVLFVKPPSGTEVNTENVKEISLRGDGIVPRGDLKIDDFIKPATAADDEEFINKVDRIVGEMEIPTWNPHEPLLEEL